MRRSPLLRACWMPGRWMPGRWMPERFAELIARILAAYDDVVVLITGAPEEREAAERLAAQNAPRAAEG